MRTVLLLMAVALLALASCKKKTDDSPKGKLIGKWKIAKSVFDGNGNGVADANEIYVFADSEATYLQFNGDGSGATTDVNSGTSVTSPFNWSLLNGDSVLKISTTSISRVSGANAAATGTDTLRIVSLTSSDLQLKVATEYSGSLTMTNWAYLHKQ